VAATVKDSANAVVTDGTAVSFAVTNTALGTITPTATTVSGVATATFTAANTAGTATIAVTAGTITTTANITILGADVGSIIFVSALPNIIGVKGSGQTENSVVTFSVKDINGQAASNGTSVTFTINGPKGGESLNPATASTINGLVSTTLKSGAVAGPVRVNATTIVAGTPISTSSTGVSIGGGVPSMTHFTLATTVRNLAGFPYVNLQSTVLAFLADRFGNFNVLQGTAISFYTEAGAIDASKVTNSTGSTSVIFRTQNPFPLSGLLPANPLSGAVPAMTGNPANGLATIIAVTRGEECFVDNNGDGVFSGTSIDTFPTASCDIGEPFIDQNDNGSHDPDEFYIDANQNGSYDGPNGVWDGNIMIWKKIQILFSGEPSQIVLSPAPFNIPAGQTQIFRACVGDVNANAPMAGSTIAVQAGIGTPGGSTAVTVPDISSGPECFTFTLASTADPAGTFTNVPDSITITVTWKVPGFGDVLDLQVFSGTIDQ
jgi:hypothetical protein